MDIDNTLIVYIATTIYNLSPVEESIKQLTCYDDKNYSFIDSGDDARKFVLKITNYHDSDTQLTSIVDEIQDNGQEYLSKHSNRPFLMAKLVKTSAAKLSTLVHVRHLSDDGESIGTRLCNVKLFEYFDGQMVLDVINKHLDAYEMKPSDVYFELGKICAHMAKFLVTQRHLVDKLRDLRLKAKFPWQVIQSDGIIESMNQQMNAGRNESKSSLVKAVLAEFRSVRQEILDLPECILHSDLSGHNILIRLHEGRREYCVIDFGDIQTGPELVDLAVLLLYNVLKQDIIPDFDQALVSIPKWTYRGYRSTLGHDLNPKELSYIPTLMKLRLCQSLLNGQAAHEKDPANEYVYMTNKRGWSLLHLMVNDSRFSDNIKLVESWLD